MLKKAVNVEINFAYLYVLLSSSFLCNRRANCVRFRRVCGLRIFAMSSVVIPPHKAVMTTKDKFTSTFTIYLSIYKLEVNFPIQSLYIVYRAWAVCGSRTRHRWREFVSSVSDFESFF